MGILNGFDERLGEAFQSPMFNMGMGLLANNTGHYGRAAPAIGAGMQQGMQQHNRNLAVQAELREKKLREEAIKRQLAQEKMMQAAAKQVMTPQPFKADLFPGEAPIGGLFNKPLIQTNLPAALQKYHGITGDLPGLLANQGRIIGNQYKQALTMQALRPPEGAKTTYTYGNAKLPGTGIVAARKSNRGDLEVQNEQGGWRKAPYGTQLFSTQQQGGSADIGFSKSTGSKMEESYIADENLLALIDQAKGIASPENFGAIGRGKQLYQDIRGQGGAIASVIDSAADDSKTSGTKDFEYDKWFDPKLSSLQVYANSLAYTYAKSLDQAGRVSDRDMMEAKTALGLARPLANMNDFMARMDALHNTTSSKLNRTSKRLEKPGKFPEYTPPKAGKYDSLWGD